MDDVRRKVTMTILPTSVKWSKGERMMDKDCFEFVVYMIHACARKCHKTPKEIYQIIESKECVSKYLIPLYDILHTQSVAFVVNDIEEYMKNRGVAI